MRLSTRCLLLAGLGPLTAFAQQEAPQAVEVKSIKALPAEIRAALGEMSDRGGPFAPGCVSAHGEPHSRFSTARVGAGTATVTVERGGIAHYLEQLSFRQVDGHWVALPPPLPSMAGAPAVRAPTASPAKG
jgi:hypothetical protein